MVVVLLVVLVIALGDDDDQGTTAAPTRTPATKSAKERPEAPKGERADLVSFQLDDRSQGGFTNIWVVWTIKNNSSEKSDYSWDWEAVDADGARVENGTQLETDVQPGQTATGQYPTTLKTVQGIKLNITDFNRTASY
ncbi:MULTISPECIES: hypothetical protein [unclassified Streptomyces]|uniref:hypothetical protein n=1 Tax=Streptomyces sp. NBRC 14336 TaxID=3030992 RepID=UPI0025553F70|nr:hypothetical protein [Streptomyces sp. NBRC 14336]WBO77986.1 hypothetical protein SBE_001552 [Streptomyces sp. SBE_14.2]